jgi:tetratricopeptide (TPR) repeat protein
MAAKLKVAHVLEGSVRKSGNQLRITAQLIDVVTDTHLWSETYDRELKNVFAIQDEIAAAVVDALKITLLVEELKGIETSPEAYARYLQGQHFINQLNFEQAEKLLKQSLAIDPDFAPAWTALGDVYERQAGAGIPSYDKGYELARNTIQKALAMDPQSGRAYAVLAEIEMFYDWDFTAAYQHMETALEMSPGDAFILTRAARQISLIGRLDEAIDLHGQSIALDPVIGRGHYYLGRALHYAHRLEEAADSLRMALFLNPDSDMARYFLGLVLLAQGDAPGALVEIEQMKSTAVTGYYRLIGTAVVQHALGNVAASDAALAEVIETFGDGGPYQIAQAYAFRGEIDNAFDRLEHGYAIHDPGMAQMLLDPLLANLRDDPRWEPFLDKMGLPH